MRRRYLYSGAVGRAHLLRATLLASTALCAAGLPDLARATDAAWTGATSDYNDPNNWGPTTVPDGIATFPAAPANSKTPVISSDTTVGLWAFPAVPLTGVNWTITNHAHVTFTTTPSGGGIDVGVGSGTVTINNDSTTPSVAVLNFTSNSSANSAIINLIDSIGVGSFLNFYNSSTAGSATINVTRDDSFVNIQDTASGGSARFILTNTGTGAAPGTLYISLLTSAGTTAGSIEGSGNVDLGSKNLTVGSLNTSTELSGVILGTGGSLTKTGSGTLTLSGTNTYDGGTTISAGALQIGNGGTTGSILGNVVNNALLIVNRSNAYTFSGDISGSGALQKDGAGTTTLTGANTYSNGTTINAGALQVGNGGTAGSIVGNVVDNALLIFNRSNAFTLAGDISGTGGVQKDGAGTTTLSGALSYSGTTTINGGTLVVDTSASNSTLSGNVAGTGAFEKAGTGTLTLTGSSYSTGATTISGGTLQVGNGGTAGTISGNITDNGTLAFNRSDNISFGGVISGGGVLQKSGIGTLSLSGNNTYSGATNILGGTLSIGAAGNLGTGTAMTMDGGTLSFQHAAPVNNFISYSLTKDIAINSGGATFDLSAGAMSATVNGAVSGNGSLTVIGAESAGTSGFLTIQNGASTFTGGVTVKNAVQLALRSTTPTTLSGPVSVLAPTTANLSGGASFTNISFSGNTFDVTATTTTNFVEATVDTGSFNNSTITLNAVIGASERNAKLGLSNGSTLGNSTIVNNGGQISLTAPASLGSANITNNVGALILGSDVGSATIDNKVGANLQFFNTASAGANITNRSSALVDLSGFGGSTQPTSAGLFLTGSTTGNVTITNKTNATALVLAGDLGTANVTNEAGATFTFSGDRFTPSTVGSAGNATISNAGTLLFDTNSTTGTATITTTGVVNLNNNDTAGTAATTVNSGGSLIGNGAVGNTTINSGGTLAPGHSIGTVVVNGTLTFASGSIYNVEVSGSNSDKTTVTGTATINGGTVRVTPLSAVTSRTTYSIISAASQLGAGFDSVSMTNFLGSNPRLSYTATDVLLTLDPGLLGFILPASASGNQRTVAQGIDNGILAGSSLPSAFGALFTAVGNGNTGGLDQVAGQPGPAAIQSGFTAAGQFFNSVFDNAFGDAGPPAGGPLGYADDTRPREVQEAYAAVTPRDRIAASFAPRWSLWATGYGGASTVNGDAAAGTNKTTSRAYGMAAGAQYRFSSNTQLGFAMGGAGTNFSLGGGLGGGKADMFNAALYGKRTMGAAYVAGVLGYTWQDVTTDRTVTVSGTDNLHAAFKANAVSGRLEGGWRIATAVGVVAPYAALQSTTFFLPAYGETATSGSTAFALSYASHNVTATRGEWGARFEKAMAMGEGIFTLKARGAWAHDWNRDRAATATFQSLPGSAFTVNGAQPAANAALVSLGGEMAWRNGWALAANFDGEFSSTTRSYAGKGTVRYVW